MKDLNYFRANQDKAPTWAKEKHPAYQGWISNSNMGMNIGDKKILKGNATVIIPDVGQPLNQTVIWGQKIEIAEDKSYLVVDGTRIDVVAPQVQQTNTPRQQNTSVATQSAPLDTNISQNPYSFTYQGRTINAFAVSGKSPDGVIFENLKVENRLGPNGLEPYRSGTVQFKNGFIISIEDYEKLSDDERIAYNEKPASDMLYQSCI